MTGEAAIANVTGTSPSSIASEDPTRVQAGNEPGSARKNTERDRRRLEKEKAALLSRYQPSSNPTSLARVRRMHHADGMREVVGKECACY